VIALRTHEIEGVIVITAPFNLDIETAKDFKNASLHLCERAPKGIIIDLRETKYVDSLGIGSVVSIFNHCTSKRKKIAIVLPEGEVKKTLLMTHIDELVDIFEDISKALNSLK
jgi:anti-anti-sigma factor